MKINEVVKNLEEEPRRKRHAYPDAEPEAEPEPDIDDQSWVDVARAWVNRVKAAPRAKPQTSFIKGAKKVFGWPVSTVSARGKVGVRRSMTPDAPPEIPLARSDK